GGLRRRRVDRGNHRVLGRVGCTDEGARRSSLIDGNLAGQERSAARYGFRAALIGRKASVSAGDRERDGGTDAKAIDLAAGWLVLADDRMTHCGVPNTPVRRALTMAGPVRRRFRKTTDAAQCKVSGAVL